jgi:5-methylcytosine-specific restriction endonuclease McrA
MEAIATIPSGVRPFKNGTGYSGRTQILPGNCRICGAGFMGTRDRSYCGDPCRREARRVRQEHEKLTGETPRHLLSPQQRRFAILERDSFRCQFCGRGPKQGVILEVDHLLPRSRGGLSELANLITACEQCNRGKRAYVLSVAVMGMLSGAG